MASSGILLALALLAGTHAPQIARGDDDDPVFQRKKLSEWVQMLRGDREKAHDPALMLALGGPGSLPAVWLGPVNPRRAALIALELIGPARGRPVLPAITSALHDDPAERIREAAAASLGRLSAKARADGIRFDEARDALVASLRTDPSGRVREAAATALGRLESSAPNLVTALAAALKDSYSPTRTAAADALRRMGKEGADALPELEAVVKDRSAEALTRIQAILAVGNIGSPEALKGVPALGEVLADPKTPTEVRKAAAESLGQLGPDASEATAVLAATLAASDAPTALRRAAATTLDQFGADARAGLTTLVKATRDEDRFVRCLALHALGHMGKDLGKERKDVITALLRGIDDNVIEVRVAAIETLGTLGAEALDADLKAVRTRLEGATRDGQKIVREAAQDALKKLSGESR